MKRTNRQTGITLIALIITIIILLILAVVTIGSIKNSNIITYAQNASTDYEKAKNDEEGIISNYESIIKENLPSGEKVTYEGDVPIPAGFYYVTGEKDTGLVISDDKADEDNKNGKSGNQFVWIPVSEMSAFAVPHEEGSKNYKGVLNISHSDFIEPDNLTDTKTWSGAKTLTNGREVEVGKAYTYDGQDMFDLFDMGTYSENYYQDKFNKMVESIAKYGGFYVGRYETSLNGSVAQSKAGQTVMNNIEWYRMYKYSETYSQSGVISEMIWGCQWDAMMRFIGETRANATGYVSHESDCFKVKPYLTGGTDYSTNYTKTEGEEGYVPYADIANNIYDLEGNVGEWTQEASSSYRVIRGGYCIRGSSPSSRGCDIPTNTYSFFGSRLTLYIV